MEDIVCVYGLYNTVIYWALEGLSIIYFTIFVAGSTVNVTGEILALNKNYHAKSKDFPIVKLEKLGKY